MFRSSKGRHPEDDDNSNVTALKVIAWLLLAAAVIVLLVLFLLWLSRTDHVQTLVTQLASTTAEEIDGLQALLNQSALTTTVNGTVVTLLGPGVAVGLTVPGVGIVYRTVPSGHGFGNDVVWDFALWDDAGYWSALDPSRVVLPATGRYAVGLNCPKCCELATTTSVEGYLNVAYCTATAPEIHCPFALQVQPINATNGHTPVPAANLYGEFELTGGTGEYLSVEPELTYLPSQPGSPDNGPPDHCTFTVRYLGRATGIPTVPLVCLRRR